MEATTLLKEDHAAVKRLFRAYEKAEGDEDEVDDVLEAHEEHGVVKTLLAQLATMKPNDETFGAKVAVIIEAVEHHVGEEEEDMFPEADKILGRQKLDELGERIEQRKSELGAVR